MFGSCPLVLPRRTSSLIMDPSLGTHGCRPGNYSEDAMTAITRELAEFVAQIAYDAPPAEVRARVKAFTLDLVGIALRARNEAESTPAMVSAVAHLGLGVGACTVIGDAAGYAP